MKERQQGFTLIELLVVVAIIGTLTGLATVNFQDARERARDAQRKGDLKQIQNALELYKNDQSPQEYPDALDDLADDGDYMNKVPTDPKSQASGDWSYTYNKVDSLTYFLVGCLENAADQAADINNGESNDDTACPSGYSYTLTEP